MDLGRMKITGNPEADAVAVERAQTRLLGRFGVDAVSRYVPAEGGAGHVLDAGRGPSVLLLHGGGGLAAHWAPLLPLLAPHRRVLAADRPGCGLSYAVDYRQVGDFRGHAARFVRDVLDGLGVERTTVVGNSIGGTFACLFALAHPQRVERLVLVGSFPGIDPSLPPFLRLLGRRGIGPLLAATVARPTETNVRRMFRRLALAADASRVPQELIAAHAASASTAAGRLGWLSILARISRASGLRPDLMLAADLERLAVPVTFVWGELDHHVPQGAGRGLAARIGAPFTLLTDAGHLPWLDQPAAVAAAILGARGAEPPSGAPAASRDSPR